jgi:hypothetical protein
MNVLRLGIASDKHVPFVVADALEVSRRCTLVRGIRIVRREMR